MFVTRKSRNLEVTSFDDPNLRNFRIGVQTVADDYTPPGHALARRGLMGNAVGFNGQGARRRRNRSCRCRRKHRPRTCMGAGGGVLQSKGTSPIAP